MIQLTKEQCAILASEDRPTAFDPLTKAKFVLVKEELFARIQHLVDAGDMSIDEQIGLLSESGNRAGWDAVEMDVYDNYDENRDKLCR